MEFEEIHNAVMDLKFMKALAHDLRTKVCAILVNVSELRKVPRGQAWIREHEHSEDKGYVLLVGSVVIRKQDAPEVECVAPELLGEMMQFSPSHERTATVVANSDCVVMRFFWSDFWKRAGQSLAPEDHDKLKAALEDVAWEHLTG